MESAKDLSQEIKKIVNGIDWQALAKMIGEIEEKRKWNKILFRPEQCRYFFNGICVAYEKQDFTQESWKVPECKGVCEYFDFRRREKMEENTR